MKKIDLNADIRIKSGKGDSKRLRRNNYVPAVIYDNDVNGTLLEISETDLNNIISKYGEHAMIRLNINGKESNAIIKEVQKDPFHHHVIHVDFMPVLQHEIIHTDIPIQVINGEYAERNGWVINRQLTSVEVEGEVENIPPYLSFDISKYKNGDVLKVGDIEISNEISILSNYNDVILSIIQSKQASTDEVENKEIETV